MYLHACWLTRAVDGFVWLDGSESLYRNWAPGEPSDPYYENCVEMWTDTYPGFWNDARCEYYDYVYKNYVCKASKGRCCDVIRHRICVACGLIV